MCYRCYICGNPLVGEYISNEHIIPNAVGGKLRSKNLLCKNCNSQIGSESDAALCEDLSALTDLLGVKKDRNNNHKLIMHNEEGDEFVVYNAGQYARLRRPRANVIDKGNGRRLFHLVARTPDELKGLLKQFLDKGEISQAVMDKAMTDYKVRRHRPWLNKNIAITAKAFPSVIKSVVNYYVEKTRKYDDIAHLIPNIKGETDNYEILHLIMFDKLPYVVEKNQVTHMIHLEGSATTGFLYGLIEYFGVFTYIVILNENFEGDDINITYCYDVVSGKQIKRDFSLQINKSWLMAYKRDLDLTKDKRKSAINQRLSDVKNIMERNHMHRQLSKVINEAFSEYPQGCTITQEIIDKLSIRISEEIFKWHGEVYDE